MPRESRKIQDCIEEARNALAALLASGKALTSPEVLALSKCLDHYVMEWYGSEYAQELAWLEGLPQKAGGEMSSSQPSPTTPTQSFA
ncbi:MAG: Spo0E family sporulation regulatory protein-aspartic acid phosphatase [Firmicutes bacterium]|nr:Spo0E family sporulation regulatory protein-aspartic acid phosphatase [Bacillota bacterium]